MRSSGAKCIEGNLRKVIRGNRADSIIVYCVSEIGRHCLQLEVNHQTVRLPVLCLVSTLEFPLACLLTASHNDIRTCLPTV